MMTTLERIAAAVEQPQTTMPELPRFEAVSHVPSDMGQVGHHQPRPKTAADKVNEYLDKNPQDVVMTVRDLAKKIGVGKSTIQRVLTDRK